MEKKVAILSKPYSLNAIKQITEFNIKINDIMEIADNKNKFIRKPNETDAELRNRIKETNKNS